MLQKTGLLNSFSHSQNIPDYIMILGECWQVIVASSYYPNQSYLSWTDCLQFFAVTDRDQPVFSSM